MWSRLPIMLALMLALLPSTTNAQSFGRLFTTPAERAALDRARDELFEELELEELLSMQELPAVDETPVQELGIVQLSGLVRRADGQHTVWLNGVPVNESELPGHLQVVMRDGISTLQIQTSSGIYSLIPGQTLNAAQGEIRESYQVTPEQVEAINAEVAARAERLRLEARQRASILRASGDTDAAEAAEAAGNEQSEQESMVQSVLEGLRVLQQLQELQGATP